VATSELFAAVGRFYHDFSQVEDQEAVELLTRNQWAESVTAT
jgi:predicted phosphoribosyltransferase